MNFIKQRPIAILLLSIFFSYFADSKALNEKVKQINQPPTKRNLAHVIPIDQSCQPLARIGVAMTDGVSHFVVKKNSSVFLPRGANYTRLDATQYHMTFDPEAYDKERAEAVLVSMKKSRFNFVRVFLSSHFSDQGFGKSQPGIDDQWLNNIADFIAKATCQQIYVVLTGAWLPANYNSIAYSIPPPKNVTATNNIFLNPKMIEAQGKFWNDVILELQRIIPNYMSSLFSIDLINEAAVSIGDEPFSMSSGMVTFYEKNFDMSSAKDRQALVDAATTDWLNSLLKAIKKIEPDILVSTSVFTPRAVGHTAFDGAKLSAANPDLRYPLRPRAILHNSLADYIDIHMYPSSSSSFDEDIASAEISKDKSHLKKPLLMGEFGVVKLLSKQLKKASELMKHQLRISCQYGFSGWALWTWDTTEQNPSFWTAVESNGAIKNSLSPLKWPNVCVKF